MHDVLSGTTVRCVLRPVDGSNSSLMHHRQQFVCQHVDVYVGCGYSMPHMQGVLACMLLCSVALAVETVKCVFGGAVLLLVLCQELQ